jgi:CheY-specific phosphatase CheX
VTTLARMRRVEDPTDLMSKLEALQEAVAAVRQTFLVQFEMELELVGMPGTPNPDLIAYGSTLAVANDQVNYQFACAFPENTARALTKILFAMDDDEEATLEDMGDGLREIPNVAAGVWKAMRERTAGEHYQLGLPIFLKGNSWVRYFPRNVNAIGQTLRARDGTVLQMVLIWQYGQHAGGERIMSTQTVDGTATAGRSVPTQVLQEAVRAVVDTCAIQMNLALEVDQNPSDPRDADVEHGSSIALTSETGGWQLAVMGSRGSCEALTRNLFAMDADETPAMADMADALGEIANVAAGVLKSSRAAAGQKVQLGLPLFMEGRGCFEFFASGIQGMAQTVRGEDGLSVHVILIWQEG